MAEQLFEGCRGARRRGRARCEVVLFRRHGLVRSALAERGGHRLVLERECEFRLKCNADSERGLESRTAEEVGEQVALVHLVENDH